jgi:hypothetical protein
VHLKSSHDALQKWVPITTQYPPSADSGVPHSLLHLGKYQHSLQGLGCLLIHSSFAAVMAAG